MAAIQEVIQEATPIESSLLDASIEKKIMHTNLNIAYHTITLKTYSVFV